MSTEREDMIEEANSLDIEFKSNIPGVKLAALIAEAKGEPVAVEETAIPSPAAIIEPPTDEGEDDEAEAVVKTMTPTQAKNVEKVPKKKLNKFQLKRKKIAEAKKRAFKTQVVTITNKDNRENDMMTTVYASFENQFFGLSKIVPLDIPVELENALIAILENTTMTLHKDEIIDGKRSGNKRPFRVKKFAISYGRQVVAD